MLKRIKVCPKTITMNHLLRQEAEPGWQELIQPPILVALFPDSDPACPPADRIRAYEVEIQGPSQILYQILGGGVDGARVWIETMSPIQCLTSLTLPETD